VETTDRIGKTSAYPDGKPDAVFSLTLAPTGTEPAIGDIEIRASQPPGLWTTRGKTPGAGYIGVARAKSPSDILNIKGGALNLSPSQDKELLLFITDDGRFTKKDRQYQVRVVNVDGTFWTAPVKTGGTGAVDLAQPRGGQFPVRMSAYCKGLSNYDAVGPGKGIKGDGKADGLFTVSIEARNKTITGIEIRNVDGQSSIWDTLPGTANGAIAVALGAEPTRLLNNRDGTVRIDIKDRVDLNLYVADNGSIAGGKTNYRASVTFADGEITWCPVVRESAAAPGQIRPETAKPKVNFLASWLGYVSTDAVGPYAGLNPDGKPDSVFGLDIQISPKAVISGIEIQSLDGISKKWGTGGTSPGAWGLGVANQATPKALINRSDGSVQIPVEDRSQFYLYAADPGDLATSNEQLRAIVHLADGSSYQQFVRRPASSTSTVVPGTGEPAKARGIITCEFRGFIADLVNTSTSAGKDGYLDGTFILKLQAENKTLGKIEIKAGGGPVRWSSAPKAPVMFLGVASYPKIYQLMNAKGGVLNIPVSGRKTLYLYAADNGLLSDPNARLVATVTFTDNTTLSAEVIK